MFEAFKEIFVHLMKHMSVILILVIILSRFKIFKNLMLKKTTNLEKYFLMIFFGLISIIGTYGFTVQNAIANTRAVGVIVAGLVSGPVVGIGAALIAGVHRYYLGGFTINAAFVSVVLQGFLAGMYYKKIHKRNNKWFYSMILAAVLEVMHFIIVIMMSRPVPEALEIVKLIGPPMILINAIGVGIFVAVLENIYNEHGRIEATATQLVLKIANRTLPYLRQGLNRYSARKAAEIILEMVSDLAAVAFISRDDVLAFVGKGSEYHSPEGKGIHTKKIMDVMKSGEYLIAQKREEIGCPESNCPLKSQMVVLLHEKDEVVGALGIYKANENSITSFEIELALGLGQLFSTQIEISKVHQKSALLAQAEIMALQAQINPHFLFNALNTIVYYCRKKPETARDLLIHLGDFYRNNLMKTDMMVDLMTEIKHVDSYVKIEMARFGEKLKVNYNVDSMCKCMVPPLILQPLVENAIKHGILPNKTGGVITVAGSVAIDDDKYVLTVEDNGVGMSSEMVDKLLEYNAERKSIGLCNVHKRLKNLYGEKYGLKIESWPGSGTRVTILIPLGKEVRKYAKGIAG